MKTLRKMDLDSMEREMRVLQNPEKYLGGYTFEEYEAMCDNGTWSGGYVDGIWTAPQVTIIGSATTCTGGVCVTYLNHAEAVDLANQMINVNSDIGDITGGGSVLSYFFKGLGTIGAILGGVSVYSSIDRRIWEDRLSELNSTGCGLRIVISPTGTGGFSQSITYYCP